MTRLPVISTPPATAGPLTTIRSRSAVPDAAAMTTVRCPLAGPGPLVTVPATLAWKGWLEKRIHPNDRG